MRNLAPGRDVELSLSGGVLDGRNPLGEGDPSDFRILLNTETNELRGRGRLPGWTAWGTSIPSNEDLHDQTLGASIRIRSTKLVDDAVIITGGEITFRMLDSSVVSGSAFGGKFMVQTFDGVEYGPFTPTQPIVGEVVIATNGGTAVGTALSYSLVLMVKSTGPTVFDTAALSTQREAITLLGEAPSSSGVHYFISATKSRIYVSTGQGKNQRIIADGLGGMLMAGDSPWSNIQTTMAQAGDHVLFTNGIDNVLIWPLGGTVVTTGLWADKLWAAQPIVDLLGLKITRAGVVAAWNGWSFLADVTVNGAQFPSRIYWSDFGNPFVWAPGGESLAGYQELEPGERVLQIAELGKTLRVYTDKSVYRIDYVGGDRIFQITKMKFSGNLALSFKNSFVNAGDTHAWLTQDSLVVMKEYDNAPSMFEWLHRGSGFIFKGLDGSWLNGLPEGYPFTGFGKLDKGRCHQIAAGYNENEGDVWISWPTVSADTTDFEGVRRMTMLFNLRYNKATIVNHGFTAFGMGRLTAFKTVRDFMIEFGVCTVEELLETGLFVQQKEGLPLNTPNPPPVQPTSLWNEANDDHLADDPTYPMSESSLAAQTCDMRLAIDCKTCVATPEFAMASALDFTIKQFDAESRLREEYLLADDNTWEPNDTAEFPNVRAGAYQEVGYPMLIQGEIVNYDSLVEKSVSRIGVTYDAEAQAVPGKLHVQLGMSNSQHCVDWFASPGPKDLDCLRQDVDSALGVDLGCPPPDGPGTDDPAPPEPPPDTVPVAAFSFSPTGGEASLTVQFTDESTGDPVSWSWNFGDGSGIVTDQNPGHAYLDPGTYDITLTVADADGDTDSVTHQLVVSIPIVTPPDVPGLAQWLMADLEVFSDLGITPALDGEDVYQWNDQGGSLDVSQNSTTGDGAHSNPTYLTNQLNGLPIIKNKFVGDLQFLNCSALFRNSTGLVSPGVFICVVRFDSNADWPSNSRRIILSHEGASALVLGRDTTGLLFAGQVNIFNGIFNNVITGGAVPIDTWCIVSVLYNGANSKLRLNGSQVAAGNTGSGGFDLVVLGGTGYAGKGIISLAEVVRNSNALQNFQIAGLELYLNNKWDVY